MSTLPSSPTNSSISSSDLDTESTGSFFHDRSTSLGNLMGVTVQAITFSRASQLHPPDHQNPPISGRKNRQRRRRWWWWWRLCREESDAIRRASLGQYLEVERLEQGILTHDHVPSNGRSLFAHGRVLPPPEDSSPATAATGICRFSAGLCRFGSVVL